MGRGYSDNGCSKTLLVIINGIFMILGLGILALGIYLKVDPSYSTITNVLNQNPADDAAKSGAYLVNLEAASIVIIIIGSIIAGISIIGILGACFEIKALIIIYGIVITLVLLALIAIGIAALVFKYALRKNFEDEFKNGLKDKLKTDYEGEVALKSPFTIAIDMFQVYFECCGVNNFTDYDNGKLNKTLPDGKTLTAPIACCRFNEDQRKSVLKGQFPQLTDFTCASSPSISTSNYQKGCLTEMNTYLDKILLAVLIITLVIGFILIIGSISSCCMCRAM